MASNLSQWVARQQAQRHAQWQQQCLATGYKFVLRAVGDQGRYGVADVVTGKLVKFRADGRLRSWSSVQRAIAGVNALNGWQSYT